MNPLDLLPFLLIGLVMWFLIIKPQMDERRDHESLVGSLAKDDRVVTKSGIHGRVFEVREDTILLEIGEKTRITLDKMHVDRREEPK